MPHDLDRRKLLKALPLTAAGLTLAAGAASAQSQSQPQPTGTSRTLVAYYSRTGNTAVIARQIRRARDGVLFDIKTLNPYPEDYEETVAQASRETKSGYLPPLGQFVASIRQYETIYLGFPIWGMTAPPVIRSFLKAHDLFGKTVMPFITHGGYGLGDSMDIVTSLAEGADVRPAFSMEADQEKRTLQQVTGWLTS